MYDKEEKDVVDKVLERAMPEPIDTEGKIKKMLGMDEEIDEQCD